MKRILLLALLTGCFTAHHEELLDCACTDLSENVAAAGESVLSVQNIPQEWWTLFGDEQLNRMIEAALECNPTIREAEQRIHLAYELALEARSKLLPYLDGYGQVERQKLPLYGFGLPGFIPLLAPLNRNFNLITLLLRGNWEIDLWGKNRNLFRARLDETTAAQADMIQAQLILSTQIASVYFNLQSHLKQLEIIEHQARDREHVTDLLRQRFFSGVGDEFHLFQEEALAVDSRDAASQMRLMIEMDQHALAALVSNSTSLCDLDVRLEEAPAASFDQPFPLPENLPINLIARRPDIRATIWRIEASSRRVKASKARFFPNLDLAGVVGFISFFYDKIAQTQSFDYDISGTSILPIYTGGELTARLGQSQAELEIAVQKYNQTILNAVQEVSDALSKLRISDERLIEIGEALLDSEGAYELINQKYEHGIETLVTVLNANYDVLRQALTQATIQLDRHLAIVSLIRAIGGGYGGC